MHWSAMLTGKFMRIGVDGEGGIHERGLRIEEGLSCCAGGGCFPCSLKLEVLVVVVQDVDDCDYEQGEVWKVRKAKARAAGGGELVAR